MWPVFTVAFVAVKRVSTNLTGIRSAFVCEELVYKDGTTEECVIESRSVCGDSLMLQCWVWLWHYRVENLDKWLIDGPPYSYSRTDLNDNINAAWPSVIDEDAINIVHLLLEQDAQ